LSKDHLQQPSRIRRGRLFWIANQRRSISQQQDEKEEEGKLRVFSSLHKLNRSIRASDIRSFVPSIKRGITTNEPSSVDRVERKEKKGHSIRTRVKEGMRFTQDQGKSLLYVRKELREKDPLYFVSGKRLQEKGKRERQGIQEHLERGIAGT